MAKRYVGNGTRGGVLTVNRKRPRKAKPHEAYVKRKKEKR